MGCIMKNRHKEISLRLTTALATAILLSACGQSNDGWTAQRDTAICVDGSGNRVPDDACAPRTAHAGGSPFLWYYLGRSSSIPPYGDRAAGGSFTRTSGATYFHAPIETAVTRSMAVARGGFGESAHGFGGFGE